MDASLVDWKAFPLVVLRAVLKAAQKVAWKVYLMVGLKAEN